MASVSSPPSPTAIETRPATALPVLLSVPHSGHDYGEALLDRARLGRASLERLEDPLVDKLVAGAIGHGCGAVIMRAPRAMIDCNRAEDELDPRAIIGRHGPAPTPRARAGLGIIPTRLAAIGDLWRAPIDEAEFERRLSLIHRPYHAAIDAGREALSQRCGDALLIDCHSMPPRPRGEANVVIGDRHGSSAAPWLSDAAQGIAERLGFAVARNVPFAGGHIVARHGRPDAGFHALQIEVDRSTYCLRDSRTPGPGFGRVATLFEALACHLGALLAQRWRDAAE
jgi:N-formylglutamate amidohydrolase